MAGIFISYRREDSGAVAGRLFDRLIQHFGKRSVFRDIDALDPGVEFAKVIAERIRACDALIALIGRHWLDAKDAEGRRRLDQPRDFVSAEIAEALAQNKLVIPALIEGVTMPSHDTLPPQIAGLADRNAVPISDSRFDYDVGRLIQAIEKVVAPRKFQRKSTSEAKRRSEPKRVSPDVTASAGSIAAGGNVTATASAGGVAVIATGRVTIGITLAEYEERLKKREQELREDLRGEFATTSRADKEKIALLEKELANAEAKARSLADEFEKYEQVLATASQSLERIKSGAPTAELENARQALSRGDTGEAERLFEKVLKQDTRRAGEAAYQLGKLAESRIDYATADKHYGEAAKLQPENAQYLDAAGMIAYRLGRYVEAQPLLGRALAIREKSLGPDHPEVATSLNNLAELYHAQGLYTKAEPLYQESLVIQKKSLGPNHPDVATSLSNLAGHYHHRGLHAKAEPVYEESLAMTKKSLGSDHPHVATSLNNLATFYHDQGLYAKAEPLYQESLAIRKKSLGSDHPDVAQSLNNLAELYRVQALYAKAEPLHQESLAMTKKSFGLDHHEVASSLNNLALLYLDQGLYAKAEPLFQESLAIWKKSLGTGHPHVATSLSNLAGLYRHQGLYAKAELLYQESLAMRKKSLGSDHPGVAIVLENYAQLLMEMKREKEAAKMQSQAKEIRARLAGR